MPIQTEAYLNVEKPIEITPVLSGGVLVSQNWYIPAEYTSGVDREQHKFERAFSTMKDALEFLNEAFNYPLATAMTAMRKPKAVEYTTHEGGAWYDRSAWAADDRIFAIKFDDGSIWDPIAGWR